MAFAGVSNCAKTTVGVEDADIKWSDDACMAADVKEAIAQMVFDIGV